MQNSLVHYLTYNFNKERHNTVNKTGASKQQANAELTFDKNNGIQIITKNFLEDYLFWKKPNMKIFIL